MTRYSHVAYEDSSLLMGAVARVTLPDGNMLEAPLSSTCADVAAQIGPGLAKAAIACYWNDELCAMEQRVIRDGTLRIVTKKSPEHCALAPSS